MKHLIKFNELKSSTYRSAAKGLSKIGSDKHGTGWHKVKPEENEFKRRSNDLNDWADYNDWKERIKNNLLLGKITLTIKPNKYVLNKSVFTADFIPFLFLDCELFEELFEDSINDGNFEVYFQLYCLPIDVDSLNLCKDNLVNIYGYNLCLMWVAIQFKIENDRVKIDKIEISTNDDFGDVVITRSVVGKIKSSLISMFTKGNNYPSGYNDVKLAYDLLERTLIIKTGLSSEYGLIMDDIKKDIVAISANTILSDVKK